LGTSSGLELIPQLLAGRPGLDIVVVTAYATVDTAVEAVKRGARDYLPKPFTPAQIRYIVDRIRERRSLENRVLSLEARAPEAPQLNLQTRSPRMRAAIETIRN